MYGFSLRMYDQRLGRWHATDPYGQHWSPYLAMSNNPVSFVDPDGGWDHIADEPGPTTWWGWENRFKSSLQGVDILPNVQTSQFPGWIQFGFDRPATAFMFSRMANSGYVGMASIALIIESAGMLRSQINMVHAGDAPDDWFYNKQTGELKWAKDRSNDWISLTNSSEWINTGVESRTAALTIKNTSISPFSYLGNTGAIPASVPTPKQDRVSAYRDYSLYTGYHPGESSWDHRFRLAGAFSYEARREFAGGGFGGFGGFRGLKSGLVVRSQYGNYVRRMSYVDHVQRGEKLEDLITRLQYRTMATNAEHAVVRLGPNSPDPGARVIVSGGRDGIFFPEGAITKIYGHTHPYPTGVSRADKETLTILKQTKQCIFEGFNTKPLIARPD